MDSNQKEIRELLLKSTNSYYNDDNPNDIFNNTE